MEKMTQKYVQQLLSSAPNAMAEIKSTISYVGHHSHEENVEHVKQVFARTVHSPEALYGISAFIQKQVPDWGEFHSKSRL